MTKDPYRYFRLEARELADELHEGVLRLEQRGAAPALVTKLLRVAHTLKGAARVVRQTEIADRAHEIEDVFAPHRESGGPLSKDELSRGYALVDAIRAGVAALDGSRPQPQAAAPEGRADLDSPERPFETVRVTISEMDGLLDGVLQVGAHAVELQRRLDAVVRLEGMAIALAREADRLRLAGSSAVTRLDRLRSRAEMLSAHARRTHRELETSAQRVSRDAQELRERASGMRLVPAQSIAPDLERSARDAAASAVNVRWTGGELKIDAHVLATVRGALIHVIRNAVAHGIEDERVRRAAKKPLAGTVEVEVLRRGHRALFRCRDDGRGIDLAAVRGAAVARGVASPQAAAGWDMNEAVAVLLKGGVSTASEATHASGRGVGLDAVRAAVSGLGGTVHIESEPGRGTSVELTVPLSLSSLPVLVVEAAKERVLIPLDSVIETVRMADAQVVRTAGGSRLLIGHAEADVVSLAELLRVPPRPRDRGDEVGVVVQNAKGQLVLTVDRIAEVRSVIVRPLPAGTVADPIVAAATLGDAGTPEIVLATHALAAPAGSSALKPMQAQPRLPILVIDDSLTTRMLEQSILESAGYEVDLAVSAEEGLEKARQRPYALFLVDVEMPGMSGFEFVELTRSDAELRQVPAILVTSRGGAEDRARGMAAGAHDYVDKGEFDQRSLLRTIRELVG